MGGQKSLLTKLGLTLVLSKRFSVSKVFDVTCIKILMLLTSFRDKDAILCVQSSNCTFKTHFPLGGGTGIFAPMLGSRLIFFSISVALIVMLPVFVCGVLDDLLCITSKTIAAGGRSVERASRSF